MKITIYTLSDPRNNEIKYIGRTKNTLKTRLYGHLHKSGKIGKKYFWIKSLKKENLIPIIEEIETIQMSDNISAWEESHKIEKYWIEQFTQWGFDLKNHNDRGAGNFNFTKGSKKGITVYLFDKNNNYIDKYISLVSVAKKLNISYSSLRLGLKRNSLVNDKYYLSYNKEHNIKQRKNFKNIYHYNLDGTLIDIYYNWDFLENFEFTKKGVRSNLYNEIKTYKNYVFSYEEFILNPRKEIKKKKILQYDCNSNFIKEWSSCKEIVDVLKFTESKLRLCCSGKIKMYKGYIWMYKI